MSFKPYCAITTFLPSETSFGLSPDSFSNPGGRPQKANGRPFSPTCRLLTRRTLSEVPMQLAGSAIGGIRRSLPWDEPSTIMRRLLPHVGPRPCPVRATRMWFPHRRFRLSQRWHVDISVGSYDHRILPADDFGTTRRDRVPIAQSPTHTRSSPYWWRADDSEVAHALRATLASWVTLGSLPPGCPCVVTAASTWGPSSTPPPPSTRHFLRSLRSQKNSSTLRTSHEIHPNQSTSISTTSPGTTSGGDTARALGGSWSGTAVVTWLLGSTLIG